MGRKRGSRFRKAADAQEQLESIEHAQNQYRKGKGKTIVYRKNKTKKRFDNSLKWIRNKEEGREEYL